MAWTNRTKTPLEFLLMETGEFLLLEDSSFIYLDQVGNPDNYWTKRLKA